MRRSSCHHAFTLIEMITVIAVIAILTAMVLSIAGFAQNKGARSRAEAEIMALASACEAYKADNGVYPQDADTDALDARQHTSPVSTTYQKASLALYKALSGDLTAPFNGVPDTGSKVYAVDFFKPSRLNSDFKTTSVVRYIVDPFGNSFGYSTANSVDNTKGYNPTFDLWSTGGSTGSTDKDKAKWLKNW